MPKKIWNFRIQKMEANMLLKLLKIFELLFALHQEAFDKDFRFILFLFISFQMLLPIR